MATVAVLADPPVEGFVLPELVAETPLSAAEAARLYGAMTVDVCRTVQHGGADLLVNYRDPAQVPGDVDSEARLRGLLDGELEAPADARFEVQVGETLAGRAGNTVTHLIEGEGEPTVAVVDPTAAFLGREQIGSAAMKLRSSDVVLGPAGGGRVYYAGFAGPVDFAGAYAPPALATLTDRAREAGLDVDFLPRLPVVETGADLADALVTVRARRRADRSVPRRTAETVAELGITAEVAAEGLTVAPSSDSS